MLTLLVASQTERVDSVAPSSGATRVVQFMRLNPPVFTGAKVEEDLQGFIDEMKKIFWVIHATEVEGVEFTTYQLKDVAH